MEFNARETWMRVGADVELCSEEKGFEGSWFEVKILSLNVAAGKSGAAAARARDHVCVQYAHFHVTKDPGSENLTEVVPQSMLRPLPPWLGPKRWAVWEAIEAYFTHAWWAGFIREHNASDDTYVVYFGPGQEDITFPPSLLRTRVDYFESPCGSTYEWRVFGSMMEPPNWAQQDALLNEYKQVAPVAQRRQVKKAPAAKQPARGAKRPREPKATDLFPQRKAAATVAAPKATELSIGASPPAADDESTPQSTYMSSAWRDAPRHHHPRTPPETAETVHRGDDDRIQSSLQTRAYQSVLKAFHATGALSCSQSDLLQALRKELRISRLIATRAFNQVYGPDRPLTS